jgi:hypothetical protein
MPAVRQKRSKLAPTSCQASSTVATGTTAADVVSSFMALLSFVDSAPRAYRLKVGNACPPISTSTGTSPRGGFGVVVAVRNLNNGLHKILPENHAQILRQRDYAGRIVMRQFSNQGIRGAAIVIEHLGI